MIHAAAFETITRPGLELSCMQHVLGCLGVPGAGLAI